MPAVLSSSIDERDRGILEHLRLHGRCDIESLCRLLGVTRTAIRQRLGRMESAGWITASRVGQSRGRPKLVYGISTIGSRALGDNYRDLAQVLWLVIGEVQDEVVRGQLLNRVRDVLAERFQRNLSLTASLEDRVDHLAEQMRTSGYRVDSIRGSALPILRETCCPFPLLADADDSICQVERQVVEKVLGAPVEFRSRCRDGQGCCEFQVVSSAAVSSAAVG